MWQIILTLSIIAAAGYFAIKPLFKKKTTVGHDCNCGSSCAGCPVMDLKSAKKL